MARHPDTDEEYWPFDGDAHSAWDLCNNYLFPGSSKSVDCLSTRHSASEPLDFEDVIGAMQDEAWLPSLYQVARETLEKHGIPPSSAAISVCSNRPGYRYNSSNASCAPKDNPGSPGYRVIIHVAYTYTLGSSWGVPITPLSLTR